MTANQKKKLFSVKRPVVERAYPENSGKESKRM
jgi:hypothetical protein